MFPEAGGTTVRETEASNDAGEDVHRHTGSLVHWWGAPHQKGFEILILKYYGLNGAATF